jgi:hypothetical protein
VLSADVEISAGAGNQVSIAGDGLFVPLAAGLTVLDTATVDLTLAAGVLSADVITTAINADGWIDADESWAFASATTITVPSDATLKYQIGDKIRFTQDATTKYFYVVGVTATVLTVTAGTDYTVTASAITVPFYSHTLSPLGFPQYFNYTPTFTGFSAVPATPSAQFCLVGKLVTLIISTGNGTSNATDFTATLPISMAVPPNTLSCQSGGNNGTNNNGFQNDVIAIIASASPTIVQFLRNGGSGVNWTASNNKAANCNIAYFIA